MYDDEWIYKFYFTEKPQNDSVRAVDYVKRVVVTHSGKPEYDGDYAGFAKYCRK